MGLPLKAQSVAQCAARDGMAFAAGWPHGTCPVLQMCQAPSRRRARTSGCYCWVLAHLSARTEWVVGGGPHRSPHRPPPILSQGLLCPQHRPSHDITDWCHLDHHQLDVACGLAGSSVGRTDRQTDRQTDKQTNRQTDRPVS
jgi:hypothetical protein